MAITVMAVYMVEVKPGHNRGMASLIEWARRDAKARGWTMGMRGRIRENGVQVIDIFLTDDVTPKGP